MLKQRAKMIEKIFANLSEDEILEMNEKQVLDAQREFKRFYDAFYKGECSYCGKSIKTFSNKGAPCFHWLLRPKKVKKKHIKRLLCDVGLIRSDSYLRWVANSDRSVFHINDLEADKDNKAIIQHTIKYRQFEWSFSCNQSDLKGHSNQSSHFHFQMLIDGRMFIKYSDFHVPLSDYDMFMLSLKYEAKIPKRQIHGPGAGMELLATEHGIEELLAVSGRAEEEELADIKLDTIVVANEGESLSGEAIYTLMKEAQGKNIPFAQLAGRLNGDAVTYVTPVEEPVEKAKRNKTKRNK